MRSWAPRGRIPRDHLKDPLLPLPPLLDFRVPVPDHLFPQHPPPPFLLSSWYRKAFSPHPSLKEASLSFVHWTIAE